MDERIAAREERNRKAERENINLSNDYWNRSENFMMGNFNENEEKMLNEMFDEMDGDEFMELEKLFKS